MRSLGRVAWAYPRLMFFATVGSLVVVVLGARQIINADGLGDIVLGVGGIAGALLLCASYLYDASGMAPVGRHPSVSSRRYLLMAFGKNAWIVLIFVGAGYSWFVGTR